MVSEVLDEAQDLVRNRIDLDGDVLGPGQLLGFRMLGNGVAVPHPRGVQQQGVNNVLQKFTNININENEFGGEFFQNVSKIGQLIGANPT